jgi:hypothetical protein
MADYNAGARHVTRIPSAISRLLQLRTQNSRMFWLVAGQNPYAERLVGSVRRECLDHLIVLGEQHLRRILKSYFSYYHRSRTHLSLDKGDAGRRDHRVWQNSRNACATRKQCSCSKIAPGSTCALVELDCRGVKTTSAYCKLEL